MEIRTNNLIGLKTWKFTSDTPLFLAWYEVEIPLFLYSLCFSHYKVLNYPEIKEWQWLGITIYSNASLKEQEIRNKMLQNEPKE